VSRVERLINLTATLLETDRPLTRDEVAERVAGYHGSPATVRRAFERDKETLRELGVPVEVTPVDPSNPDSSEGYRIPKASYYLPDPGLEPDELAALHLAATAVRLPGTQGAEALWKLGGAVGDAGAPAAVADLPGSEHLVALFATVSERRTATFTYRGVARTVDPWRISFRNGHWYLTGRDHAAGEERSYRVDRFESAVGAGPPGGFERPAPAAAGEGSRPPWLLGEEERVTARLLVDADQAGWAVGHLGEGAVAERRPDGGVVVEVPVTNRAAFRSFVLGFLDHAEVLGPPELRADLVAWLEALAG
jgi:proteasome accessory factor B